MVILERKNCVRSINSKIPEYARNYKKEWLFIRGINKTLFDFVSKYEFDASQLFVSSYSDKIKYFIKNFLKAQERGYLKDTSCFIFKYCDAFDIEVLFNNMEYDFDKVKSDVSYSVDLSGYRDFYKLFCKFYDKINIGYEELVDINYIEYISDPRNLEIEIEIESDNDLFYEIDSDSDSDSDSVIDSDDIDDLLSTEDSETDSD